MRFSLTLGGETKAVEVVEEGERCRVRLGDEWLDAITVADFGVPVSSEDFSADVTASANAAGLQLEVTYATADRHVLTASAGALTEGTQTYLATLDGAERVLSISFLEETTGEVPDQFDLTPANVSAGDPLDLSSWAPLRWRGTGFETGATGPRGGRCC